MHTFLQTAQWHTPVLELSTAAVVCACVEGKECNSFFFLKSWALVVDLWGNTEKKWRCENATEANNSAVVMANDGLSVACFHSCYWCQKHEWHQHLFCDCMLLKQVAHGNFILRRSSLQWWEKLQSVVSPKTGMPARRHTLLLSASL